MRTEIILSQCNSQKKINCAFNLDTAGWIIACYKEQRLVKIELTKQEGRSYFYCEFATEPEEKCDYREFLKMREERCEELKQTVAAGLAQLASCLKQIQHQAGAGTPQAFRRGIAASLKQVKRYLADLRESRKNSSALNTKRKQQESTNLNTNREGTKKIAALNKNEEAAYV